MTAILNFDLSAVVAFGEGRVHSSIETSVWVHFHIMFSM